MSVPTGRDMAWLQTGWEQNQGRSSHIRHYRLPAPCEKGASRNSLLQCNKMSVKAKQVDDKARQIRFKYGKSNLEWNFKKGVDITPFVTKVQIRKTQERNRLKSAGRLSGRKTTESERVHFATESDEKQILNDDCTDHKSALTSQVEIENDEENIEEESSFSEDMIAVQVNAKTENTNYLYPPETSEKEREDVQNLIKSLSRRFRDPIETSRRQIPAARPTAAYAKPTKGEIALSIKGPVLLAPVSKAAMATAQSNDRRSRLDVRSLPEFTGSRNEQARIRPISSVSDSVIVTGRKIHGAGRVTWLGIEHARNGALGQNQRLCHSCKDQRSANCDTNKSRERTKSAMYCGTNGQRKSDGCLPQMCRQFPTKLHDKNAENRDSNPKRRQKMHNGMVSPFELQVDLNKLKSYDYGSPVPPPSLSNSDDEAVTM